MARSENRHRGAPAGAGHIEAPGLAPGLKNGDQRRRDRRLGERRRLADVEIEARGATISPAPRAAQDARCFGCTTGQAPAGAANPQSAARPRISVVIPTLNEADNLTHVLPKIPDWIDEVLLIDGMSTDGTIEIARGIRADIIIVRQPRPGKGAALAAGFAAASGDIIVTLDADGSADPAEISAFVGALLAGADYAKGSRFLQGGQTDDMEWFRRAGNWGLRVFARLLFGGRYSDLCYGYNAFWRHALEQISITDTEGFEVETKMNLDMLTSGLRIVEIPSHEYRRIHGDSHLRSIPDGWRVLRTIVRERLADGRNSGALGAGSKPPFADGAYATEVVNNRPRC